MHRWFFLNELEYCEPKEGDSADDQFSVGDETQAPPVKVPTREWPFCVTVDKPLEGNEKIAVTGNCNELGNWEPNRVVLLEKPNCLCEQQCTCCKFEGLITIPRNIDIEYRYCLVAHDPIRNQSIIRFWEVHMRPRIIRPCQNMLKDCDRFGYQEDGKYRVDRGWATTESIVHFRIFNAPFVWQCQRPRTLYVHLQPMFEAQPPECAESQGDAVHLTTAEQLSRMRGAHENDQSQQVAYTEVAQFGNSCPLQFQPWYGARCGREDLTLYHCAITDLEHTLYRLDLYTFSQKGSGDEPPYHYGYGFVQANQVVGTEGFVKLPVTCASTHRPLIEMSLSYMVIRPMQNYQCDLSITYERYWRRYHLPLDIGHRGAGTSYWIGANLHRENTLFAFKRAIEHNADMVEFDIQLTKDAKVVVYHDHVLRFLLGRCPEYEELMDEHDMLVFPYEKLSRLQLLQMGGSRRSGHIAMPFDAFNYDQLKLARVLRFTGNDGCETSCERMLYEQSPFPLLIDLLRTDFNDNALPERLGFNIEIKWPQKDITKRWEGDGFKPSFDRNFFVDTILDIVLVHGGKRRIMFSCFDPDICTMLRYKQNRYPVLLITQNPECSMQYLDQRVNTMSNAINLAYILEFFGLELHTYSILKQPTLIAVLQDLKLKALAWGAMNVEADVRDRLKQCGVIGVIYDRIDQLDQAGLQMQGINLCLIDSAGLRPYIDAIEVAEWWAKCGYRPPTPGNTRDNSI
ncbi:glycerophosphocholine phosphodiesterase GPCPD1 [Scaptodrosophila lebanonensis]|uniref:Glycerophosphocholine phosphodiesterase GPCPD1 n=1 Tax=Drosophila lebanonensis TaxID=7225 RepID=A0A6J2UHP6_DROLE|nr:glycerophosphocholine phosphodiesterase GPCPD1 [Scaptodrosophila lebanonensis]